jgi:hypothetical protein
MAGPVHLTMPADRPEPTEGCDVCAALVKQRATARARADASAVSDCNVEIAAHTGHRTPEGRK